MRFAITICLLLGAAIASAAPDPRLDEIDTLRLAGEYDAAIAAIEAARDDTPDDVELLLRRGVLAEETGDLDGAALRFDALLALPRPNPARLVAMMQRARVHQRRGELDAADALWRELRAIYDSDAELSARDLYAIAEATRQLGTGDPQLFQDAVWLFDQAARQDPALIDARIALGELLLEKYNNQEASQAFREALEIDDDHPRALLGLARSQHFDYSSEAVATTLQALSLNPNLVPARVFLARLFIELEQYEDARREAELALAVDPVSLEALTLLAVVAHLGHDRDGFAELEQRVLELNPAYAGFYTTLADLAAHNRLYRDAADFAARAVKLDPRSWRGHGLLGMNRMRLGDIDGGRASLERSFEGDPYNAWIKNTLQLADTFDEYEAIERDKFLVVLHGDENELLEEYIHDLAADAYRHFRRRYRHEPATRIRIELYPEHDDFSVRSVGLAGVGLLGVAFGPVVAMDSPAARPRSAFNWGSTLWHELAHVFHLSMTDNRVPRWFSEGLAVREERLGRPGWGGDVDPGFLLAYLEGKLLPVSLLNNGFVRPTYDEQVIHSYYQSSLVFDFIESRWGFDVVRGALNRYRDSADPDAVLPELLGLDSDALDAAFDAYFQERFATALAALSKDGEPGEPRAPVDPSDTATSDTALPDKYLDQFQVGELLFQQGDFGLAETFLLRAQQLFPEYAGADSSYRLLATLYQRQDRPAEAEVQLERMVAINAEHYGAHRELAELRARRGDIEGAIAALEAALYIYPYDPEVHDELARLYAEQGNWRLVTRERRALLALDPVDRAEAHYALAEAYRRDGDRSAAREQIIYALEIAPNYIRAQELLLALLEDQTPEAEPQ